MSTDADRAPTAPASLAGGVWTPAQRTLTVGLVLAVTFVAFEALAVATILPVIGRQLGDLRLYGWVFSAFLLASLIGIVLAGTFADRVPLRRPMLAGLALFALGLVIGGTAPDMVPAIPKLGSVADKAPPFSVREVLRSYSLKTATAHFSAWPRIDCQPLNLHATNQFAWK